MLLWRPRGEFSENISCSKEARGANRTAPHGRRRHDDRWWRVMLSQTEEVALEIKTLDAHDGQGLTLAHTAGLRTGCITGRQSSALLRRAHEMNMEFIYMKQALKMPAYEEIVRKAAVSDSVVAYVGDDLPDLPVMRRVGLAVAVGNAVPEVKETAHYTTKALAGHGAIRETVELILKSKGIWDSMIDKARA